MWSNSSSFFFLPAGLGTSVAVAHGFSTWRLGRWAREGLASPAQWQREHQPVTGSGGANKSPMAATRYARLLSDHSDETMREALTCEGHHRGCQQLDLATPARGCARRHRKVAWGEAACQHD